MIAIIPIEPLSNKHALLIIEAFNRYFIDGGGKEDGDGCYGYSNGDGHGDGHSGCVGGSSGGFGFGNVPEEWLIDEISMKPTGG